GSSSFPGALLQQTQRDLRRGLQHRQMTASPGSIVGSALPAWPVLPFLGVHYIELTGISQRRFCNQPTACPSPPMSELGSFFTVGYMSPFGGIRTNSPHYRNLAIVEWCTFISAATLRSPQPWPISSRARASWRALSLGLRPNRRPAFRAALRP